jgi:hypothetical protein
VPERTLQEFTPEPKYFWPGFLRRMHDQGNVDKNFILRDVKTTLSLHFVLTTYLNKGTDPPHSEARRISVLIVKYNIDFSIPLVLC